jgi:hypothetical protein
MKLFLTLFLIFISASRLLATWTWGRDDVLIIGTDTLKLFETPLDKVLTERHLSLTAFLGENSDIDCLRNYFATWKIENNKLYLVGVTSCSKPNIKADLNKLFPDLFNDGHVFANWVNEDLLAAKKGDYLFAVEPYRIFAKEKGYFFIEGILKKTTEYDNSKSKRSRYLDDPRLFANYIYSNIRWNEIRSEIENKQTVICSIVSADETGRIDSIRIIRGASELLNREAVRIIKSIPEWEVLFKKGKQVYRQWTFPIRFDLETMGKYYH